MNAAETPSDSSSAMTIANHTPSISNSAGSSSIDRSWNTSVRINEIIADTTPSPSAVKKNDAKMLKPLIRKDSA